MTIVLRSLMLLPKLKKDQLTEVLRQDNEDEEVETKPCFQTLALMLLPTWPAITDTVLRQTGELVKRQHQANMFMTQ